MNAGVFGPTVKANVSPNETYHVAGVFAGSLPGCTSMVFKLLLHPQAFAGIAKPRWGIGYRWCAIDSLP